MEYIYNFQKEISLLEALRMAFFEVTDCVEGSTQNVFWSITYLCAKRASKIIVPPIGTFLTNYGVTNRKLQYELIYSIVRKRTISERNNLMETSKRPF